MSFRLPITTSPQAGHLENILPRPSAISLNSSYFCSFVKLITSQQTKCVFHPQWPSRKPKEMSVCSKVLFQPQLRLSANVFEAWTRPLANQFQNGFGRTPLHNECPFLAVPTCHSSGQDSMTHSTYCQLNCLHLIGIADVVCFLVDARHFTFVGTSEKEIRDAKLKSFVRTKEGHFFKWFARSSPHISAQKGAVLMNLRAHFVTDLGLCGPFQVATYSGSLWAGCSLSVKCGGQNWPFNK